MRRRIGTVVVAELTVIALVDDLMVVGRRQFRDVSVIPVDAVEQCIKRRTEVEAAPAAVAHFIDPLRVALKLRGVDGMNQAQTIHVAPIRKQSAVSNPRHVSLVYLVYFVSLVSIGQTK